MTRKLPEIECGKVKRRTFSKIKEAIELPYLVKIQKDSYDAFIKDGIGEVLEDFSPITDYSDHFELYFLDYNLNGNPKYSEKECRDRDATYDIPLEVRVIHDLTCRICGDCCVPCRARSAEVLVHLVSRDVVVTGCTV